MPVAERKSAVKADPGAAHIEMVLGSKQHSGGGGQGPTHAHAVGQCMEFAQLHSVDRIVRLIRASKMAHDQARRVFWKPFRYATEFIVLHAEPVHSGVQLDPVGMPAERAFMSRDLARRVQQWRE